MSNFLSEEEDKYQGARSLFGFSEKVRKAVLMLLGIANFI
jgi:hypothetical protein